MGLARITCTISTFPGSPGEASVEFVAGGFLSNLGHQCICIFCSEHTSSQAHQTKLSVSQLPLRGEGVTPEMAEGAGSNHCKLSEHTSS